MLKEIFLKESKTVNNAIITLGDTDDSGKGRHFKSRFIQPGVAGYPGQFGNVLITKESLDKFINTMVGVPVIINHKDLNKKNVDDERVGVVNSVWYDEKDGWYWCDGIIWDETAQNLITDKNWSVSCSYDVKTADDKGGSENNIKYDIEFLDGVFTHLALVNNPRYERANIVLNSKDIDVDQFTDIFFEALAEVIVENSVNNERWITIKPHGDDSEDYRRLKLEDGETPKEAMHRMGWDEKRKAKDEQKSRLTKYLDKFEELEDQSDKEKLDEYLEKSSDEILKIDIDSLNDKELKEAESYIKKSENYYIHYLTREKLAKIKRKIQEKLESQGYQKTKKELTEVAGVKKGKPMTHYEADNGNVNPNYKPNSAYSRNCQSCVVCYELRRRGFNLKTKPRVNKGYMQDLALDATLAYIDPKTGRKPEKNIMKVTTPDKAYDWLQDNINDGRYEFRVVWKKSGYGHIITAYKENGNVVLYDPQTNKTYKTKDEMKNSILNNVKFRGYEKSKPFALRVDNLDINQEILDSIVERF